MVPEGDVQVRRDVAELAHEEDEGERGGQLEEELRLGREAEVLLLLELLIVVEEAYGPEYQREEQAEDVPVVPAPDGLEPYRQAHERDGGDKHDAAHRRRPGLGHMPGGAVLAYRLAGLYLPEPGHQRLPHRGGGEEADGEGQYKSYAHLSLFLFSSMPATISRSSM